jgi:hypothetical protein
MADEVIPVGTVAQRGDLRLRQERVKRDIRKTPPTPQNNEPLHESCTCGRVSL